MKNLVNEVRELLKNAGIEEARLEIPKQPAYGDVSTSAAFELGKKMGQNPYKSAKDVASRIDLSNSRLVAAVEAVPPGYLNFYAKWDELAKDILGEAISMGGRFGEVDIGKGRYVLVEHTSVNPNKALHIGHARNTCLGDSIVRLLVKTGYRVAVANYIDDSGAQMAEILLAFQKLGYSMTPPPGVRFDDYCGRIYSEVSRKIESDPMLNAEKRKISAALENRSSEVFALNRVIVEKVLKEQLRTCWRLGARYDILNRESDIILFDLWNEAFEKLRKSDSVYLLDEGAKKGCWMIKLDDHPTLSKEGDEVLVKSDGVTTYVARDIAYAAWKLGVLSRDFTYRRWCDNPDGTPLYITDFDGMEKPKFGNATLTVNVVDVRQKRPQEIVRHALRKLGADPVRYIHYAYEVVSLSRSDAEKLNIAIEGQSFIHMSGRAGIYINVDPLLDYIKEKAIAGASKRHPEWKRDKLDEVGEKIAVAGFRYFMLRSDPEKMIVFDSEEASDIEGDTGPYIQYAYARATRILEKADAKPVPKPYSSQLMNEEKQLVKTIGMLPLVFEEAVKLLSVKRVVTYLRELAVAFNEFYERCPVLTAEEDVEAFRLAVVEGFRSALSSASWVSGLPLLDEM
ncbi:MAG: arginine--tRNA ligase [Candidatus Caldarchaeum sp.]